MSLLLLFSLLAGPVWAQEQSAEQPEPSTEQTTEPSAQAIPAFSLVYSAGPHGALEGVLEQQVAPRESGSAVAAVPEEGYAFAEWSDGSTENPRLDTPASDLALTAHFAQLPSAEEPPNEPEAPATEALSAPVEEETSFAADYERYKKYLLFQKYEKRALYKKYLRYRELASKYPWEAGKKTEKKLLKKLKSDSKKYRKKPSKYPHLAGRHHDYVSYHAQKAEYFSLKPYAGYSEYMRYDRDDYEAYKDYGSEEYRLGYERYLQALAEGKVSETVDPDLDASAMGPEITVGLFSYNPRDLKESSFSLKANKAFNVVTRKDEVLGTVAPDTKIRVRYQGDKRFLVYYSGTDQVIGDTSKEVRFVPAESAETDLVFDVSRPNSSFDRYRDGIRLKYYDAPEADQDRIWVINALPLEHYVWGMGEITGTGPGEYNRVMTTVFRTYGYWKIKWSTKYAAQGFKVDATSGSQIYYGYDWEVGHDTIRQAAEATRGKLVLYDGEVALTPYSSWTDGKTRRYEDGHWGHRCNQSPSSKPSSIYPWLSGVSDSRGQHDTKSTCELASLGNHMVGLSANGAVRQAKLDNATYDSILTHYYSGVGVTLGY